MSVARTCFFLLVVVAFAAPGLTQKRASDPTPAAATQSSLDTLLSQTNQAALQTVKDIGDLRIDKWKLSGDEKDQLRQSAESLQRNLTAALPELLRDVRQNPAHLAPQFRLYRNLDAVFDVLAELTQAARAAGKNYEFKALNSDVRDLSALRRMLAERLEQMAEQRDQGISPAGKAQPRPKPPPTKIIVDEDLH